MTVDGRISQDLRVENVAELDFPAIDTSRVRLRQNVKVPGSVLIEAVAAAVAIDPRLLIDSAQFHIDALGGTITPGTEGRFLEIPWDCTITAARVGCDVEGAAAQAATVAIWMARTVADRPPTVAGLITGTTPLTLNNAQFADNTALTGWTVNLPAGAWLCFVPTAIANIGTLHISLTVLKQFAGAVGASGASTTPGDPGPIGPTGAAGGSTTSVNNAVSAAGTTQGGATTLTSNANNIDTCAAAAGVVFQSVFSDAVGTIKRVKNTTANDCKVYPDSGANIDALAANAADTLFAGQSKTYIRMSNTQWRSF